METNNINKIINHKEESPFKPINKDENVDNYDNLDEEDVFATGLPEWNLLPPHIVVRRKLKK